MQKPIILIGPMGAGKSAIGRQLARRSGLHFFDTDEVIQQRTGVDIPLIFEIEGESGFRAREKQVLEALLEGEVAVIATGGGIILDEENRRRMNRGGMVVFLETGIEWQVRRTHRTRQRPLLDTPDPQTRLEELYRTREPMYRECAHVTVNTDGRRVAEVTDEILQELRRTESG